MKIQMKYEDLLLLMVLSDNNLNIFASGKELFCVFRHFKGVVSSSAPYFNSLTLR